VGKVKTFIKSMYYPDKDFYKLVFGMAIPIALQSLITIGVNITDTLMLGMLGETQLSASSLATQFVNMFQTFVMGTSMGASVLAARYWGMQEMKSLHKTIAIMFRIILGIACIFASLTFFAPNWIMHMYTSDEIIISEGVRYLNFAVLTFFLHGLSQGSTIILRSVENVKMPMRVSVGAFVMNIIGNYILMFGKLGLPAMGIAGASLSTLIVRLFECIFNFGYLAVYDKDVHFRIKDMFIKTSDLFHEYIRISLPVLVSDGLLAFGNNIVMMIVGRMGAHFVAANAVTAVVERLCTAGIGGTGQASAMITGKALGEGNKEKVQKQGIAFFGIGTFLGVIACLIILCIVEPVISIYNLTGETADITRQLLHAAAILTLFQSSNSILTKGTLRGGGDTKVLMIADSIFLWVVSVPLGYIAGLVLGLPAFWVYFFLKSENICKTIWGVHRLQSGKWIKKIKSFG
jgi:putative MATE family efflux protein